MKIFPYLIILLFSCSQTTTPQNQVDSEPCSRPTNSLPNTFQGINKMVLIPSGNFLMGDSSGAFGERLVHRIEMIGFYMDQTPVTYADFQKYVAESYIFL